MFFLLACTAAPESASGDSPPSEEPAMQALFEFVVVADCHVYDAAADHAARLQATVDWINRTQKPEDLVLIVGDIAWGSGLPIARPILDQLTIPWVPINGDNEVQLGSEEAYDTTFSDHYAALSTELEGWEMGPVPVQNPEVNGESWIHNLRFQHDGVRFVGLDWAARVIDPLTGETGALHDFPGGTLPWLKESLPDDGPEESVVMFSHLPMHLGGFNVTDTEVLQTTLLPFSSRVWADYAGHYHVNAEESEPGGYELRVTDATWDDAVQLRVVSVEGNGERFLYTDQIVTIPS